ncbi:hypothetical protein Leryth_007430 [Lithospermum erythrorhizon]|nr:hypothetical protein Leryth_007430 [Lithospermum erythrorhizon]
MGEEEGESGTFPKIIKRTILDFTVGVTMRPGRDLLEALPLDRPARGTPQHPTKEPAIVTGENLGRIILLSEMLRPRDIAKKQDKIVGPMGPRQNPIHQNLPSAPDHFASGKYKASPI